jgi:hypothetical protein
MVMVRDFFEDYFSDMESDVTNDTTFPFIDKNNDKEVLKWLNQDIQDKANRNKSRLQRIRQIEAYFKGINYRSPSDRNGKDNILGTNNNKPRDAKIFVNFVNEMVEAKVSQRSRFKPAITILPGSDEIADKNNSQTCKQILDCKAQELDFEKIFSDGDKIQFLRGESYTWVLWDKLAGGLVDEVKELVDQGIKIPGKSDPMKGDVKIFTMGPDRCFPQVNKVSWDDVDDISYIEWIHQDELKALYPKMKDKIFPTDNSIYYWDATDMTRKKMKNYCMVVNYYHKGTRFLPQGRYCKYIQSVVLENKPLSECYAHLKLPVIFDTDIDLDGELHGRPFTDNITRLQALHNMVMAATAKGFAIASNPKWVAPAGSIAVNKVTNEYGLMEYKGAVPPQLVTYSGVPRDAYELSDRVEKFIQTQAAVYGISRGTPPPGIKAAVALNFLDEQEQQRESRGMAKRQRRILDTYKLVLYTISQYYTAEDNRIFQMLGTDNSYLVKSFNLKGIRSYDIRFQNSSSLPDSKTGKIAAILDINMATANDPYFGREEISTMLEMGNDQRFRDKLAVSVKSADTIIQMIMDGVKGKNPNEWDDFIVQYPIFLRAIQERDYKDTDQYIVEELKAYITTMEYMMFTKAQISPPFMMRLQSFYMFPIFFKVPVNPVVSSMGGTGMAPPPIQTPTSEPPQHLGSMQKDNQQQLKLQQKEEHPQ